MLDTPDVVQVVVPVPAPDSPIPPDLPMGPDADMLTALDMIVDQTRDYHSFISDRRVRELQAQFDGLADEIPPEAAWRVRFELGNAHLLLGRAEPAIEHLSPVYGVLGRLEGRISTDERLRIIYRLGVAHLRLGELDNCCQRHNADSCILPIQGGGLHTEPRGSQAARRYLSEVLRQASPTSDVYLKAQWLYNVAAMTLGEYPHDVPAEWLIPPQSFGSEGAIPRFENIAPRLGLAQFDLSGGVIIDDFDLDGYLDIVHSTNDPTGQMQFFLNNRDGTFTDRHREAGLTGWRGGLNMVQADYNNDGAVDVFVLRGAWLGLAGRHPNSLLRNNGDGTFADVTFRAGLGDVHYPTQTAAWGDYDNDGDLDLFVGNESSNKLTAPCQLFRNNGDGTFSDVAEEAGVTNLGFAKGVVWGDYDHDGCCDLYVSNQTGPNRLYRNLGDGTFRDVAPELDVTGPRESFPCWFWDFNNDGHLDIFASAWNGSLADVAAGYLGRLEFRPIAIELSCLYRGDGRGGFEEVSRQYKLNRLTKAMGCNFGDLDNDGLLDFYLGTGDLDYEDLMPNVMYLNRGTEFVDVTMAGGFGHLQKGHAISFTDLDHDGDQDVYAEMGGGRGGDEFGNALFENPGFGNHWVGVWLVGCDVNRSAIGARVRVDVIESGAPRTIYKHVTSGGSFGANPLRQTIGLGKASRIERLEVEWPSLARRQVFTDVPLDRFLIIVEGRAEFVDLDLPAYRL